MYWKHLSDQSTWLTWSLMMYINLKNEDNWKSIKWRLNKVWPDLRWRRCQSRGESRGSADWRSGLCWVVEVGDGERGDDDGGASKPPGF